MDKEILIQNTSAQTIGINQQDMAKNSPFEPKKNQTPQEKERQKQDQEIANGPQGPPDKDQEHYHKLGYTRQITYDSKS